MRSSVLIVDNDKDIRMALEILLNKKGFDAFGTGDFVPDHLARLPDIILMDFYLSGKSGKDICKTIKTNAETKNITIIMMSASPSAKDICLEAGASAFINKPFQISEVINILKSTIHKAN